MNMLKERLKDFSLLGIHILNLTTSILITSALFASALVVSAWSAFVFIISAATASIATAKPLMRRTLKAWLLFVTMQ